MIRQFASHCWKFLTHSFKSSGWKYVCDAKVSIAMLSWTCNNEDWQAAIPTPFTSPEVLSYASDKAKLFPKKFSNNSYLDDSGMSLPDFPSRNNRKLYNISVTPNFDSSRVFGLDCIPSIVMKKLWAWTCIHTSWTLQYLSEGILFSRLLEGLDCSPCI